MARNVHIGDHQPYTTPTKGFQSKRGIFRGGGVRIVRTQESSKIYTTPKISIAMLNMVFVGVVRGLWGSITSRDAKSTCFKGSRTLCDVIIFWHVFFAKFWPEKITSRDGCVLPIFSTKNIRAHRIVVGAVQSWI